MSTGWNTYGNGKVSCAIINLLGNEYWLEPRLIFGFHWRYYKPTGK